MKEEDFSLCRGSQGELGTAAAVHYFPNWESAELGVEFTQLPQVVAPYVRNERTAWNG
jgi:hypothetical protein